MRIGAATGLCNSPSATTARADVATAMKVTDARYPEDEQGTQQGQSGQHEQQGCGTSG
ncbi:MAG: hypothetical protein WCP31_03130 [Chloroflexales bacterium]